MDLRVWNRISCVFIPVHFRVTCPEKEQKMCEIGSIEVWFKIWSVSFPITISFRFGLTLACSGIRSVTTMSRISTSHWVNSGFRTFILANRLFTDSKFKEFVNFRSALNYLPTERDQVAQVVNSVKEKKIVFSIPDIPDWRSAND